MIFLLELVSEEELKKHYLHKQKLRFANETARLLFTVFEKR